MLGAISGDIIGSVHEFNPHKDKDFPLFTRESFFTDDTILTVATADLLLNGGDYAEKYRKYPKTYPRLSYGENFRQWVNSPQKGPYNSFGNGSAMRVSPVGWKFHTIDETLMEAERSAKVTHNHPEGIKGALATAGSVYLARRKGITKDQIKSFVEERFGYNLDRKLDDIRPSYQFDVSCQGSVPEAIIAFLESTSFEDSIRNAVSLGGDADTQAAIAGGIAEAFYNGVPDHIAEEVIPILDEDLLGVVESFRTQCIKT